MAKLFTFMAVVARNNLGWIICHESFIRDVYSRTKHNGDRCSYTLNPALFDISTPFRKDKSQSENSDTEMDLVETAYKSLRELFINSNINEKTDNSEARQITKKFHESVRYPDGLLLGRNDDEAVIENIGDDKYLFPNKCVFYSYDIKDIGNHLRDTLYHFILLDPPWWNKFIRRKRKANSKFG